MTGREALRGRPGGRRDARLRTLVQALVAFALALSGVAHAASAAPRTDPAQDDAAFARLVAALGGYCGALDDDGPREAPEDHAHCAVCCGCGPAHAPAGANAFAPRWTVLQVFPPFAPPLRRIASRIRPPGRAPPR